MKIKKNNINHYPLAVVCAFCESEMEIESDADLLFAHDNHVRYICPCCKRMNELEKEVSDLLLLGREQSVMLKLSDVCQDPNFETRTIKLREELAKIGIEVSFQNSVKLANCYTAQNYLVYSERNLSNDFLHFMRKLGVFGPGQEFSFQRVEDSDYLYKVQTKIDSSG